MYNNITLICTRHEEKGRCSLDELTAIMENHLKDGEAPNQEELLAAYKKWKDVNDERENEMLANIYHYCKEHTFERGLFFVGAAHRASIINNIQKYDETEDVKPDWNYSNYDGIFGKNHHGMKWNTFAACHAFPRNT